MLSSTILAFSRLILSFEEAAAVRFIDEQRSSGIDIPTICVGLLEPTARLLGEMWESDTATFVEVTVGVGMLNRILKGLGADLGEERDILNPLRRFLLVTAPGEQHLFGAHMVADFLRRAGWEVVLVRPQSRTELCRLARNDWFAVVGFSISRREQVSPLAGTIKAVRRASSNESLRVMVGGPGFRDRPEMVARVGADTTAADARQAVIQAEHLFALMPARTVASRH